MNKKYILIISIIGLFFLVLGTSHAVIISCGATVTLFVNTVPNNSTSITYPTNISLNIQAKNTNPSYTCSYIVWFTYNNTLYRLGTLSVPASSTKNDTYSMRYSANNKWVYQGIVQGYVDNSGSYSYTNYTTSHYSAKISKDSPVITITSIPNVNYTYNGTSLKFLGNISSFKGQLAGKLYINNLNKCSLNCTYSNTSGGVYIAIANTSGNTNFTSGSARLAKQIYQRKVSQTLSSSPSFNFVYSGSVPTITDTLNVTLVSKQSNLLATLDNNSATTGSTYSLTTAISSFNFPALAGKYAQAGVYTYSAIAISNINYSFLASATLSGSITQATPSITLTATRANYTYNGTTENISGSSSQASGTLYINGISKSSPYKNATAGTFTAVFNTSGNQNYSSATATAIRKISQATLTQSLSSSPSSPFTYSGSVPTITDTLSGTLVSGQSGLSFTLNNNSISTGSTGSSTLSSSSFSFSALAGKYAAAGSYSYTSTSSGNTNYTITTGSAFALTINKATPTITLTATRANYTYNGTTENITGSATSSGTLYINGISKISPYKNATVGIFSAWYNVSGNINYSSAQSRIIRKISIATPTLSHTTNFGNFTYNGSALITKNTITSIGNQLIGKAYKNGIFTHATTTSNNTIIVDNATAGLRLGVFNTTGNINYTASSVSFANIIYQATPSLVHYSYIGNTNNQGNFTYNGTVLRAVNTITSLYNQLIGNTYKNGIFTHATTTSNNTIIVRNATAGSRTGVFNTTGNINYTSASIYFAAQISQATPTMTLVAEQPLGNYTYNGTPMNSSGTISTVSNQLTAKLYRNGIIFGSSTTQESTGNNATAGIRIYIWNTTGNVNYTANSLRLARKITQATITQSLSSSPSSPFTYSGSVPTITDTLSSSTGLITQSSISFNLINNSVTASTGSSTLSSSTFNFVALPGIYAEAGTYSYTATSSGNINYTVTTSPALPITINKATAIVSLSWTRANFTYNGTTDNASGSVTTPVSGLSGTLYINGLSKSFPYKNATAGTFTAVFNTSGNQNYSSSTATAIRKISQATPSITFTASIANFTYNGTKETFTGSVSSLNNQVSGTLYINSVSKSSPYGNATAGTWSGWYNTTVNQNYSAAQSHLARTVSKATLNLGLSATLSNYTYNGTTVNFTTTAFSTVNNQITATLYRGAISKGTTTGTSISYKNATVGTFIMFLNGTGNINYSITNARIARQITQASPTVTLSASPSSNYNYNNTGITFTGSVKSVFSQLTNGELYVAGTSTTVLNPYTTKASAGTYSYIYNTTGNINYTSGQSPTVSISILLATPIISLTATRANYTYNGTTENISGSVTSINNQVSGTLFINGVSKTSSYKNATAGTWSAWYNTTANQNYSALQSHLTRQITQATLSQTLKAFPSASFTYSGSVPTIQDTLSGTLVSGQSGLSFTLNNNSIPTGSSGSSTLLPSAFNFTTLAGKYAQAGGYLYTSTSSGNTNYTITTGSAFALTINKASPSITLTATRANYTYNGTTENISGSSSQASGTLYINGVSKSSPYKNATAGVWSAWFNTTANQNYSTGQSHLARQITQATPSITLTASIANFTYNGTKEKFIGSVTVPSSGVTGLLYTNGMSKTNPYSNATAGEYIVVFNTSGNINYTSASLTKLRDISRATLSQSLAAFPSSTFIYSGSPPTITDTLSGTLVSGQSGLSFTLNNNSILTGSVSSQSLSTNKYNFSTLAGKFAAADYLHAYTYSATSSGNINYTVSASSILNVNITKAPPTLSLTASLGNFTYNGTKENFTARINTINNQVSATLYNNNLNKTSTFTTKYFGAPSANTYVEVFNTTGNQNYSSSSIELVRMILRAVLSLTQPDAFYGNFTYNGSNSAVTSNISASTGRIVPGQNGLIFILNNNSEPTTRTIASGLSSTSLSFPSTQDKYAGAGISSLTISSSGNANYTVSTSPVLEEHISKASPTLSLTANLGNFTYNGTKENITARVSSLFNQVSAKLYKDGVLLNAFNSGAFYYANASAHAHIFILNTSGNTNYTSSSDYLARQIYQATPALSLKSFPSQNFTQNGTSLQFQVGIASLHRQIIGDLYINGSFVLATSTQFINYSVGDEVGNYTAVFSTSGNINYTAYGLTLSRAILFISGLNVYINSILNSNVTVIYSGAKSNFTAAYTSGGIFVGLYINNTLIKALQHTPAVYLSILPAGLYKITAFSNTSGVTNKTFYEKINKATPTITLTATRANYTYNGTTENISGSLSSINNQLSGQMYVNSQSQISPYKNATAGVFTTIFNTSGNQNYTAYSSRIVRSITKATPVLSISASPSINYTQNGTYLVFEVSISSLRNQINGSLYINGVYKVSTKTAHIYNFTNSSGLYLGVFNTTGDINYSAATASLYRQIIKIFVNLNLYLNGIENANRSIIYGTQSNFTATISATGDFVDIYVNDTKVTLLSSKKTIYLANLSAGLYKIIAASNGSSVDNLTYYEQINKAVPNMTLAVPANFTYNGSYGVESASLNTINNQLNATLSLNGTAIAKLPLFSLPLKIENNQSAPNPSNFQQELVFNSYKYKKYEAANLDNIKFIYPNGTVVPSWLETNNSYNSSHTVYWLKIGSIPANNFITVYMLFLNKTINTFNNISTGEAPQLSLSYAEYDDGRNVFTFYGDFHGDALNSTKWDVISDGGTYNVSNGLTTSSTLSNYIYITSRQTFSYPALFEWYSGPFTQNAPFVNAIQFGFYTVTPAEELYLGAVDHIYLNYAVNATADVLSASTIINNNAGSDLYSVFANGTKVGLYFNYKSIMNESSDYLPTNVPFTAVLNYESGLTTPTIYWARVRTYPVNGTMPNVVIGNISTVQELDLQVQVGIYEYNLTTIGNQNYTVLSITKTYQIYKPASRGGGILTPTPIVHISINYSNIVGITTNGSIFSVNSSQRYGSENSVIIDFSLPIPEGDIVISFVNKSFQLSGLAFTTTSSIPSSSITITKSYQSSGCYGEILRSPLYFSNITTAFNESGLVQNVSYFYSLNISQIQNIGLNETSVQRYKCSPQLQGWEPLPTYLLGTNGSTAYYKAESDSFSAYAVAAGVAIPPNATTKLAETGLPNNVVWNATYGGVTTTVPAPESIYFSNKAGIYNLTVYSTKYVTINGTSACIYTYSPSSLMPGSNTPLQAGSSLTVVFSPSVRCVTLSGTQLITQIENESTNTNILLAAALAGVILVLVIINLIYLYHFRRKGNRPSRHVEHKKVIVSRSRVSRQAKIKHERRKGISLD